MQLELPLYAAGHEAMIERVEIRALRRKWVPGEHLSAHGFQRWLAAWRLLEEQGWQVAVLVSRDETHAVGMAWRLRPR